MGRVKKAEREAVEAALLAAQDDLSAASEQAIRALDAVRQESLTKDANRPYVVLMQQKGQPLVHTFGPYATHAQASRAMKDLVCPGPEACSAVIQKLREVPA